VVERPKALAALRDTGRAWFKFVVDSVSDLVKVEAKPLLNRESPGHGQTCSVVLPTLRVTFFGLFA